jgi:hypothetical protein
MELNEYQKKYIDQFIDQNNGLVFHYTKLNEIVSEFNNTELFYLIAYKKDTIIGVCPVHRIRKGILQLDYTNNGNYEIPYGGWVFNVNQIDFKRLWSSIPVSLLGSLTYHSSFIYDIPEILKKKGKKFETGVIDLSQTIEAIWQNNINPKKRNKIRKAEKSGISIKNYGKEGLNIYYSLLRDFREGEGLSVKSFNYYEKLLNNYFPEKILILISYLEERPLTGVVILGNKNVMHYWHGASANDIPNLGQGELLQWEAIKWAKNQGSRYYDLCVIEQERLPAIAQFKMGFTRELIPFYCLHKRALFFRGINRIKNALTN